MPIKTFSSIDMMLGLEYYITDTQGVNGKIRCNLEDFIVEEILLDGQVVPVEITGKSLPKINQKIGSWIWIIIEKKGIDTITLIRKISKILNVKEDDISFGGLKDANAITAQIISIRNVNVKDIEKLNNSKIKVRTYYIMDKPFTTHDIYGNEFTITIRSINDIDKSLEIIKETLRQIMERGLPTYYGYQRFGLKRPNTHIIGKYILLEDFENAVIEILSKTYGFEDKKIEKIREFIREKKDFKKAYEIFPKSSKYFPELTLLKHLSKNPRDYVTALRKLPKQLLKMYIEAYQSYLFNKILSRRIERGLPLNKVVEGDIVVLLDHYGLPTRHVMHVSEKMIEKINKLIIEDKVIPVTYLLGYKLNIVEGIQGDIVREVLKEEGISIENFYIKSIPEISIKGSYRPLYTIPKILKIEKINENTLRIVFRLTRGNYATILLREIIKPKNPIENGF